MTTFNSTNHSIGTQPAFDGGEGVGVEDLDSVYTNIMHQAGNKARVCVQIKTPTSRAFSERMFVVQLCS